ncbi:MAG: YceD family protein [Alphaproteobacteria bacterium]
MTELTKATTASHQEWSEHISAEDIGDKPLKLDITLPPESEPVLCNRLDLYAIDYMKVHYNISRNPVSKVIHVAGKINAEVQQRCVVTLEPVAEHIEDEFEAWFAQPSDAVSFTKARIERMSPQEKNEQPMLEECDDPEKIIDGKIDLGELATQHLSLSLNPYPRKEEAVHDNQDKPLTDNQEMYKNPFAALKDWKTAEKGKG